MKAAKLVAESKHNIIEVDIPTIDEFEVLVKVSICGLCASELPKWKSGVLEGFTYMGHEIVGIVVDKGRYVTNVTIGDRVTGYICDGFAEYAKAHHTLVTKVPEVLEDCEAMGEPLGCLVSGIRQTGVEIGDESAIIGLGYMGLGFMQLLKASGSSKITAIDVRQESLDLAMKLGATDSYFSQNVPIDKKVLEYGVNMAGGYDIVVEASGVAPALNLAVEMTGLHKKLSVVGFHHSGLRNLDMCLMNWKAIRVINAHERRDHFMMSSIDRGLKMIANKRIDMKSLITHEFGLNEIDRGFDVFDKKEGNYIKGYIKF